MVSVCPTEGMSKDEVKEENETLKGTGYNLPALHRHRIGPNRNVRRRTTMNHQGVSNADNNGTANGQFTFFTPAGDEVTGHPCFEMAAKYVEADPRQIPPEIQSIIGEKHVFQIHFSSSTRNGLECFTVDAILDKTATTEGPTSSKTHSSRYCRVIGTLEGSNLEDPLFFAHIREVVQQENLLSFGGRLTLIKVVLRSLRIYYLSIFKAPRSVLKILGRMRVPFFLGRFAKHEEAITGWNGPNVPLHRSEPDVRNSTYLRDMLLEISQVDIAYDGDARICSIANDGVFLLVLLLDRLPHHLNLSSRGMEILEISCPCNGNVKSNHHIFFECDIAKDIWRIVRRVLHFKWRAKVTAIEESKDLTSLSLDELIGNLKVHEMIIKKDSEIVKAKVERKSIALKAKKESSDEECSTSVNVIENALDAATRIILLENVQKPPKDKNQRAFVRGSWSDRGEEDDEKICLGVDLEHEEWINDSGCSKHMTGNRKLFSTYKAYNEGNFIFGSNLCGNIIGKGQICNNKCRVTFSEHDSEIIKDGKVIGRGIRKKGLYVMKLGNKPKDQICLATIDENSTLWHRRLGHANMCLIQSLASKELVRNLPKLKFDQHFCDACKMGKQAHASHKAKNIVLTTRCLELLHMDLFGPSAVRSYGGNRYTLVIVDDYSRYTWTRFLKDKTEAFDQFEIFSRKIQNQLGCSIVSIRTDHGREFDNEVQFGEFCNANGITHNFSAPRTPQSNGVVERKNRTLQEMSRTMLNEQSLPQKFWCNAVDTSTYILNRILIRAILGKTP
ncbi:retrovirus-related pol polyprotein from transposon TNT 1-94 [Tanacetum coccineum]